MELQQSTLDRGACTVWRKYKKKKNHFFLLYLPVVPVVSRKILRKSVTEGGTVVDPEMYR